MAPPPPTRQHQPNRRLPQQEQLRQMRRSSRGTLPPRAPSTSDSDLIAQQDVTPRATAANLSLSPAAPSSAASHAPSASASTSSSSSSTYADDATSARSSRMFPTMLGTPRTARQRYAEYAEDPCFPDRHAIVVSDNSSDADNGDTSDSDAERSLPKRRDRRRTPPPQWELIDPRNPRRQNISYASLSPTSASSSASSSSSSSRNTHLNWPTMTAGQTHHMPRSRGQMFEPLNHAPVEQNQPGSSLNGLFAPPTHLIFNGSLQTALEYGKMEKKWLMIHVFEQDNFRCMCVNRDIWRDPRIRELVQLHFIFVQFSTVSQEGHWYRQFYASNNSLAMPHVAILDPRTQERMLVAPDTHLDYSTRFEQTLREFLQNNSLHENRGAQMRREAAAAAAAASAAAAAAATSAATAAAAAPVPIYDENEDEEAQLQRALRESLALHNEQRRTNAVDYETGARSSAAAAAVELRQTPDMIRCARIRAIRALERVPPEPSVGPRVQIRHVADGSRVVRRFSDSDTVEYMYAFAKSAFPALGEANVLLSYMNSDLGLRLDETIHDVGLHNCSVLISKADEDDKD